MFKKIEIWILYLTIVLGIVFVIGFGALVRHEMLPGRSKLPSLSKTIMFVAKIPSNIGNLFTNDLTVRDRFQGKTGFIGDSIEQETYLLLSRYDANIKESIVELIDLTTFETLHSWNPDITYINSLVDTSKPEFKYLKIKNSESRFVFRHPLLTKQGGIIFAEYSPLIKIDFCSNFVWINQEDKFHHSLEFDSEGNILAPIHQYPSTIDEKYIGTDFKKFYDDTITKISKDGKIIYQKSVTEIFLENSMKHLLFTRFDKDPIHLNDIQPVLADGKHWKKGDIFLSFRNQSMIMLFRPITNKIIWIGNGEHGINQHDVNILNDHQISIFNNNVIGTFNGNRVDGNNEVVIYDFDTNQYSKYLNDSLKEYDLKTELQGRATILDNGDLFVQEQNYGRVVYINADGTLQWEYINRASDGNVYYIGWSRILYQPEDIVMLKDIFKTRSCNHETN